jgi:hypothetical protein
MVFSLITCGGGAGKDAGQDAVKDVAEAETAQETGVDSAPDSVPDTIPDVLKDTIAEIKPDVQKDIPEEVPEEADGIAGCKNDDECKGKVPDLKICEKAKCNTGTGECVAGTADDGTDCDDGNPCTGNDKCENGQCKPGKKVPCKETVCNDSKDNDGDGKTDCKDKDCLLTTDCSPVCSAVGAVECGKAMSDANDKPGSTDVIDSYNCNSYNYPAPEIAYIFTVDKAQNVIAELTDETDETDLMIVEEADMNCFATSCIATGLNSAEFLALPGKKYYVVVDGWNGAVGSFTLNMECSECEPQCGGKICGDDLCGGDCGKCGEGKICLPDGSACSDILANSKCEAAKVINPDALPYSDVGSTVSAEDNYFFSAGSCPGGSTYNDSGLGGRDVVYTLTSKKLEKFQISLTDSDFNAILYLVTECSDIYNTCIAAQDLLYGGEIEKALKADTTYYIIVDGSDETQWGEFTLNVKSLGECKPQCENKECGDNGCYGTCGTCKEDQKCNDSGKCVEIMKNDLCGNFAVIDVQSLPYKVEGSTEMASNDYQAETGTCPSAPDWGFGENAPDVAYSLTPQEDSAFHIYLSDKTDFDSSLYVVTDCADIKGTCLAGDEKWDPNGGESVLVSLKKGITYYVIIDGYYTQSGTFELVVEKCVPDCSGKDCGSDGCGGTCGTCQTGKYCTTSNKCELLPLNDKCGSPSVITSVPFKTSSTTEGLADDYSVSSEACGENLSWAAGSDNPDAVYSFKPSETGIYHIALEAVGDWDSVLYILTDCSNPENSCIDGKDSISVQEYVYANLDSSKTYFIVVDGYKDKGLFNLSVEKCTPQCSGKTCGSDGCGSTCGECTGTGEYCFMGQCTTKGCGQISYEGCCEDSTVVWCSGDKLQYIYCGYYSEPLNTCGWDTESGLYDCGGTGEDPSLKYPKKCDFTCTPDCSGKECGSDGCGGQCSPGCTSDQVCNSKGKCEAKPVNDKCNSAKVVDKIPYQHESDTSWAGDDYYAAKGICSNNITWEIGKTSPDVVYSFTPSSAGIYHVYLSPLLLDFDASLYVVKNCSSIGSTCVAASDATFFDIPSFESLYFSALANTAYYIIVDGYGEGEKGVFEINILECKPDCTNKNCGSNGCGGTCAECTDSEEYCLLGKCVKSGCGNVPLEGCCSSETLLYCSGDQIESFDCGKFFNPPLSTCGWNIENQSYDCGFAGEDPSGTFKKQCSL